MYLGKEIRLKRLLNSRYQKIFVVAFDQGVNRGVIPGNENIAHKIDLVVKARVDAITINKGIASSLFFPHAGQVALIMKASGFTPFHKSFDVTYADVEEAVRLGADSISVGVMLGDERQPEMLRDLGRISKEAASVGMPLVAHIYPGGNLIPDADRYKVEHISYCARLGAEFGVDIIKTWYTGSAESFRRVTEACPAKVVIAGGAKMERAIDLFTMTYDAISAGAAGVTYGRNIWQHNDIHGIVNSLKSIIYELKTPEEALAVLEKK